MRSRAIHHDHAGASHADAAAAPDGRAHTNADDGSQHYTDAHVDTFRRDRAGTHRNRITNALANAAAFPVEMAQLCADGGKHKTV